MTTPPAVNTAAGLHVRVSQHLPMPLEGEFNCAAGQMLAIVGPSGAGKTSMLRVFAGLMKPTHATIAVGGEVWCDTNAGIYLAPQQRHVGLVFQNYALMPHLSALDDVGLSLLHLSARERRERARHWLTHVRLTDEQQTRKPSALSGGQQQRVAVARALAREPRLLLLDEPFSAVDQMSRQGLYELLAELRRDLHIPIVLVTHDLVEARHLADSMVVMDAGKVLQQGAPAQVYRSPRNARVADLMGVQNRFHGRWLGPLDDADATEQKGWLEWLSITGDLTGPRLRVKDKGRLSPGQSLTWVIQGDGLRLAGFEGSFPSAEASDWMSLEASVTAVRNLGETSLAVAAISGVDGASFRLTRSGPERRHLEVGKTIQVLLDCDWVHVMPINPG
ncbi:ABC transporter ATP-binding protein [Ottowia caeni]|uniref:ABC transporter ATP-binding protein n=1 Tax=Ottowia caeni TaxID=2870339 RepID=UPI001E5886C2|nr:ABC transporter ATP-binding protein [Ottowia caeni]